MKKADLFETLNAIDSNNFEFYSQLSDEEKKSIPVFMLMQWMARSDDAKKILSLNASANKWLFDIYKYQDLAYHLLVSCSSGKKDFYKWKKKNVEKSKRPITVSLLKEYHSCGTRAAEFDSKLVSLDDMIEIAERLGHIDKIKGLKKEFK